MPTIQLSIDDKPVSAEQGESILSICKRNNIQLPTMCHLAGLGDVGACRLCLVEVEGSPRLFPACTTVPQPNMRIKTMTEKLKKYRLMITELLFAERNHTCAVCVANGNCELQQLGYKVGMTHVRYPYQYPECDLDTSHKDYIQDQNRCILCTRCVRACDEVEGAHNWDVMGRGHQSKVISDFFQPWGESTTCTSCGKCIEVCPTGALWPKNTAQGLLKKNPAMVSDLVAKRKVKS